MGFPRIFYLRYHGYSAYFPVWALARYRNLMRSNSHQVSWRHVTGIDRPAIGIVTGLAFEANSLKRHLPEPQAIAVALSGGDAARA